MKLDTIKSTVERTESVFKRIDDANTEGAEAEKELTSLQPGAKSFLDLLKTAKAELHEHWHGHANGRPLFAPGADPEEQRQTRDLMDRVDALITRLTPSRITNGVRIEPNQTVYNLGSR